MWEAGRRCADVLVKPRCLLDQDPCHQRHLSQPTLLQQLHHTSTTPPPRSFTRFYLLRANFGSVQWVPNDAWPSQRALLRQDRLISAHLTPTLRSDTGTIGYILLGDAESGEMGAIGERDGCQYNKIIRRGEGKSCPSREERHQRVVWPLDSPEQPMFVSLLSPSVLKPEEPDLRPPATGAPLHSHSRIDRFGMKSRQPLTSHAGTAVLHVTDHWVPEEKLRPYSLLFSISPRWLSFSAHIHISLSSHPSRIHLFLSPSPAVALVQE
ncbi:unnamed protein product [Pleuronectes platessa]|uniref:Uncharacterized protein n=1 Tax=Pleuronectes platessa TaxID=8262 RepID=A0A9N7TPA6_PLEPL|nr:unnamed protein product [Pleuronectes platessa]